MTPDAETRPEIAARGGKYPQTDRGDRAIQRFMDILPMFVPEDVSQALLLREMCIALIEQHNASWDAAMVERILTPEEPNPRAA